MWSTWCPLPPRENANRSAMRISRLTSEVIRILEYPEWVAQRFRHFASASCLMLMKSKLKMKSKDNFFSPHLFSFFNSFFLCLSKAYDFEFASRLICTVKLRSQRPVWTSTGWCSTRNRPAMRNPRGTTVTCPVWIRQRQLRFWTGNNRLNDSSYLFVFIFFFVFFLRVLFFYFLFVRHIRDQLWNGASHVR